MNKDYIIEQLKSQIENFKTETKMEKVGTVLEVGDGVARQLRELKKNLEFRMRIKNSE